MSWWNEFIERERTFSSCSTDTRLRLTVHSGQKNDLLPLNKKSSAGKK